MVRDVTSWDYIADSASLIIQYLVPQKIAVKKLHIFGKNWDKFWWKLHENGIFHLLCKQFQVNAGSFTSVKQVAGVGSY